MEFQANLLVCLTFGIICALIANSRGRSALAWFLLGFMFFCFSLVLLLVLPDLKVEEAKQHRLVRENRRLRELVRGDRQVADSRHEEATRRLSVHDQALGVDTSPRLPVATERSSLPGPPTQPATVDEYEQAEWYYVRDDDRIGPMPFTELREKWRGGQIGADTYVWAAFMSDWAFLGDVDGLEGAMRA